MNVLEFGSPVAPDSPAAATFDGTKSPVPFPTMDEWIETARNAYLVYRFAVGFHEFNDRELGEKFRTIDDFETLSDFMTDCIDMGGTEKAGVEILDAMAVRCYIVGCRIYGEEAMEDLEPDA